MAEKYTGEACGGVGVFDPGTPHPPEGSKLRLEPTTGLDLKAGAPGEVADSAARTRAWLLAMAREAKARASSLPEGMAETHDHYAHGKPRP